MLELAEKINLSQPLAARLKVFLDKNINAVERTAERCTKGSFSCLKRKSKMMRLAVILFLAVKAKEKYAEKGISDEIYYDTMSDIKIWAEKKGDRGLENYAWLKNHISLELFRLGRLQFQLYECKNKTLNYKKLPFKYGENLIYVHIPEGEKLNYDKCKEAFAKAEQFFATYYTDFLYKYYFCESWLLFEGNRDFMNEKSNIVKFMSLFEIRYSVKIDAQTIERVFGRRYILKRNYPEKTDLQRRTKAYILSGHRPGIGVGIIEKK